MNNVENYVKKANEYFEDYIERSRDNDYKI